MASFLGGENQFAKVKSIHTFRQHMLPDRCTVTDLRARFRGGAKKAEDDKDFLDFFAGRGIRINPLLYALEGNLRKNPTPAVVEAQLVEPSSP